MKIIQCENYHYYDREKFTSCPFCERDRQKGLLKEQQTVYCPQKGNQQVTVSYGTDLSEQIKTIGMYESKDAACEVTGWLVCLSGAMRGSSYNLHHGRNFAGRFFDMDICLSADMQISRENHFSIIYEKRTNLFYILPGYGAVFLNGILLQTQQQLEENMIIEAGMSRFIFVPYCKGERVWE